MEQRKQPYETPCIEILLFTVTDIITTSEFGINLPMDPLP